MTILACRAVGNLTHRQALTLDTVTATHCSMMMKGAMLLVAALAFGLPALTVAQNQAQLYGECLADLTLNSVVAVPLGS